MSDEYKTLFVRMPMDLHDAIRTAAEQEDRNISQFIRQTMRERVAPSENKSSTQRQRRA